jgi:acylglycerol lipase
MRFLMLALMLLSAGCVPSWQEGGPPQQPPTMTPLAYVTEDGTALPLRVWPANPHPKAIVLALHGMNDYANAFGRPAAVWAHDGITTYAYDQRGFGGTPHRGKWADPELLVQDLQHMTRTLRARHPGMPLYLLGESMGAAVVALALTRPDLVPVDGAILSAPAVWGGDAMNLFFRASLWLGAHTFPESKVTGQGLKRWASDNLEVLRGLARDPLFIKGTRLDAVYGVTSLMGEAYASAERIPAKVPILVLYGARDEIIPPDPVQDFIKRLPPHRVAYYADGCHLLMRGLGAEAVLRDIRAWIADKNAPLSGGTTLPETAKCRPPDRAAE